MVSAGILYGHLKIYRGQLKVTKLQLDEMKSASADTKRTIVAFEKLAEAADKTAGFTEQSMTPIVYVHTAIADTPLIYDGSIRTSIRLSLKKTSPQPIEISIAYRVFLVPQGKQDIRAQEQEMCMKGQRISRQTLSGDGSERIPINIGQPEIIKGKYSNGDIFPAIVGCIEYGSDAERKYAGFTVLVRKIGGPLNLSPNIVRSLEWLAQRAIDKPNLMPADLIVTVSSNFISR